MSSEHPGIERYIVEHETSYDYTAPVSQSWQLARLTPRTLPWQRLVSHSVRIEPSPNERRDELDSFGNTVTHFGLHGAHRILRVRMECRVEVSARPALAETADAATEAAAKAAADAVAPPAAPAQPSGSAGPVQHQAQVALPAPVPVQIPVPVAAQTWEATRDTVRREPQHPEHLLAARMSEPTLLLPLSDGARLYAAPSFARGRGWFEAVHELMQRIYKDFDFEPGATTVSTSVDEVLQQRSGVCQDFAHLMLACLRGMGLPARYVSGYLLTDPPPGQPRLLGVDATHAWVAAYSPQYGWVEFDPTNNQLADQRYITLTWGGDFADVVPLRGVIIGGGDQLMDVAVSVIPN